METCRGNQADLVPSRLVAEVINFGAGVRLDVCRRGGYAAYIMSRPARAKSAPAPGLRSASQQAESLRRSRRDHALETAQDYAEAIADLTAAKGEARVTDLARQLGVTHVTVNRTLARLQRDGYVTTQPYRSIFLTDFGRQLATECHRRHAVVVAFLRSLGISAAVAELDAEGIEHHVSAETLAAFEHCLKK